MRVGIIVGFLSHHRRGHHLRGVVQPQVGPLIAALLPSDVEVEVINETWKEPDWSRHYDLLFLSGLHPDFDKVRQISHYWRLRGTKTVYGGILPSTYLEMCEPFFDAVVIGDPESTVPRIFEDFVAGRLQKVYVSGPYDPNSVPIPRIDLIADQQVIPLAMEATRGCPFLCEFCALTGLGTRFHTRPPELVVRDVQAGQRMLRGSVPWYKLKWASFFDNNIGGHLPWLREFCAAMKPLGIKWGAAATFNVVANLDIVKHLSAGGCRYLFVGLESFSQESLTDMNKVQNTIENTRQVLDQCREHGILICSGLMLNPMVDTRESMLSIPRHLHECGLHVPSFISFESPIPGTPHFYRLAAQADPAILPNAYLRDFTGYTLVTKPQRESVDTFIDTFKTLIRVIYSRRSRMRKLVDDLPRFMRHGYWIPALSDLFDMVDATWDLDLRRTFVAGTDAEPPNAYVTPLSGSDFKNDSERRAVMEPALVTGPRGEVLPQWLRSQRVFDKHGQIAIQPSPQFVNPIVPPLPPPQSASASL